MGWGRVGVREGRKTHVRKAIIARIKGVGWGVGVGHWEKAWSATESTHIQSEELIVRARVCVCVCVCVRERERERERV